MSDYDPDAEIVRLRGVVGMQHLRLGEMEALRGALSARAAEAESEAKRLRSEIAELRRTAVDVAWAEENRRRELGRALEAEAEAEHRRAIVARQVTMNLELVERAQALQEQDERNLAEMAKMDGLLQAAEHGWRAAVAECDALRAENEQLRAKWAAADLLARRAEAAAVARVEACES